MRNIFLLITFITAAAFGASKVVQGDVFKSADLTKTWINFPLTVSKALVSDASGDITASTVSGTELGFLSGVTSSLSGINQASTFTNKSISGSSNTLTNISLTTAITGTLPMGNGGTGVTSLSTGFIKSNGTILSSVASIDATLSFTGATPIVNGGTGVSSLATGYIKSNGSVLSSVASIDATLGLSGIAPIANGGTGASSLATGFVRSNGTVLSTITSIDATTALTGAVPIANGGSANAALSVTAGGVLYTDGTKFVNVGAGSSGQFLKSNATSAPAWANVSITYAVTSKTANYTLTTSDYLVGGGSIGGAFTLTLPSAVGITGQQFVLFKTDQSLGNIITIATTSAQTISGTTTKTLATQYEQYTVQSDGANWIVLSHTYPQGWVAYTPTVTGATTADEGTYWRRVGDSIEIKGTGATSGVAAVALSVSIPSGLTVDSTKMATTTNTNSHGHFYNTTSTATSFAGSAVGPWPIFSDTSASSTLFYVAQTNAGSRFAKVNANAIITAGDRIRYELHGLPITNWNP